MDDNKKIETSALNVEKSNRSDHKKPKGEKRRTFNIVDVVLGVIILTALAMIIFFFASNTNLSLEPGKKVEIEYTVEIPGISEEMAKISINDSVFEGENKYIIGSVSNTEINDFVEYVYNKESDRIEPVAYIDDGSTAAVRKTLLVTITADAKYFEGKGYTVNGYRIAINREMELCFPGYTGTGRCISMTISDDMEDK